MIVRAAHPMIIICRSPPIFFIHENLMVNELFCEGLKSWNVVAVHNYTFGVLGASAYAF